MSINFQDFDPSALLKADSVSREAKKSTGIFRKRRPSMTDNPAESARQKLDLGQIGLKANQQRQSGQGESLTQTRQKTEGTLEQFMAAWDTLHPSYGAPTNGAGKAANDPVRKAVRDRAEAMLDPETGKFGPGQTAALKAMLQDAHQKGTIVGPGAIDTAQGQGVDFGDEAATTASELFKVGTHLPAQIVSQPLHGIADELTDPGSPESNLAHGIAGVGGMALTGGFGAEAGMLDMAGSLVEGQGSEQLQEIGKTIQAIADPTKDWGTRTAGAINIALLALGAVHGVGKLKGMVSGELSPGIMDDAIAATRQQFGEGAAANVEQVLKTAPPEVLKAQTADLDQKVAQIAQRAEEIRNGKNGLPAKELPPIPEHQASHSEIPDNSKPPGEDVNPTGNKRVATEAAKAAEEAQQRARVDAHLHREAVQNAIAEGKPVPTEVLAEYPDLKPVESTNGPQPDLPATPAPGKPVHTATGEGSNGTMLEGNGTTGRRSPTGREGHTAQSEQRPVSGSMGGVRGNAATLGSSVVPETDATGKATGLANQVQEREALSGIIREVEGTSGKGKEHWQEEGKKAVEGGEDFEALANRIGNGEEELTGLKTGILLEGKRQLLNDLEKAKGTPREEAAQERLDTYLDNIQAGKGRWSDVGRALQAGTRLDTANYAEVVQAAKSKKGASAKDAEALGELSKQIAAKDAEIERLQGIVDRGEEAAHQAVRSAPRARTYDRTQLKTRIDSNVKKLAELKGSKGVVGSKKTGARATITAKDLELARDQALIIKDIALDHARLHIGAALEDVVIAVQNTLKKQGIDIERQAVIDALSTTQKRAKTAEQIAADKVRNEAKAQSSAKIAADKLKAENEASEQAAKAKQQEFKEGERKRLTIAKRQMDFNEKSDAKAAAQAIADAEKAKWKSVQEAQDAYDKGERLKEGEAKDSYRQWWRDQMSILEAEEAIRTGTDVPSKGDSGEPLRPDQERLQHLRAIAREQAALNETKGQLKTGITVAKKAPKPISEEVADLRAERQLLDARLRSRLRELDVSKGQRIAKGIANTVRGTILGSDLGVLTRQGLFSIVRPKAFLGGLKEGARTIFSEKELVDWANEQQAKRYSDGKLAARVRKEAGLSTTDALNTHEEMVLPRLLRKLPGKLGNAAGSLERFQTTFINTVRTELFDAAYEKGLSPDELKTRARFINNSTGRGNLKNVPEELSLVLTSPRYEASRWAMLNEPVRNTFEAIRNGDKGAIENLKDVAGTAGAVFALYKAAELAGYTVNYSDPKKSDWLKLRKGKEVWDVSAGLVPRLRDVIGMIGALGDPSFTSNAGDVIKRAAVRTLSPALRTPVSELSKAWQRAHGVKEPKDPFTGYAPNEGEPQGVWAFAPLIAQSVYQSIQNGQNPAETFGVFLKEFVGGGVNFYPEKNPASTGRPSSLGGKSHSPARKHTSLGRRAH